MFAGNYILQPVTLLWNVVSVLYVCIYFGLSDWSLEIDRYIGLPIFKHFTIIGYRICKKIKVVFFFFFFFLHT